MFVVVAVWFAAADGVFAICVFVLDEVDVCAVAVCSIVFHILFAFIMFTERRLISPLSSSKVSPFSF